MLLLLSAAALLKLGLLLCLGPTSFPDSAAYVSFADAILDHGRAFAPVPWGNEALPPFIFRLAGYPLVLALAKLVAPAHFAFLVILAQIALSLASMRLIYAVCEYLFGPAVALTTVALYAFSGSLLWDNALLSDSIYASLFIIVMFTLIGGFVGLYALSLAAVAGVSLLWGYSTWTRDSGLYFTFLPLIPLAAMALRAPGAVPRRLAPLLVFLLVVGVTTGAYMTLNWYRTGTAFFGITGAANWLRPVFDMAKLGYAQPFTGDDLVSRTVRDTMSDYDFPSQMRFVAALQERCRCSPTELQSLVFAAYRASVLHHPLAYGRVVLRNFNYLGLASLLADPVATVNQIAAFGTPLNAAVFPGLSLRHLRALGEHFSALQAVLMLASTVSATLAAILFSLFLAGVPLTLAQAVRRGAVLDPRLLATGFLWFAFLSVSLLFSLVHCEARHLLPVFPAGMVGIAFMLRRLRGDR